MNNKLKSHWTRHNLYQAHRKIDWENVLFWFIAITISTAFWSSLILPFIIKKTTLPKLPVNKEAVRIFNCQASPDKDWICNRVVEIADKQRFDNPQLLLEIIHRESNFNPNAIGDYGKSRGLWQIHSDYWDLTDKQCFDIDYSTRWAIQKFKEKRGCIWTTFRNLYPNLCQ